MRVGKNRAIVSANPNEMSPFSPQAATTRVTQCVSLRIMSENCLGELECQQDIVRHGVRVAIEDRSKHCLWNSFTFGHGHDKLGTRPAILGQRAHELGGIPGLLRHPFSVLRQAHDLGESNGRVKVGIQDLANISRIVAMGSVKGINLLAEQPFQHRRLLHPMEVSLFRTTSISFDEIVVGDVTSICASMNGPGFAANNTFTESWTTYCQLVQTRS